MLQLCILQSVHIIMKVNTRKLWKVARVTYFISSCWISTDRFMNSTYAVIATDFQTKQNSNPKQDAKYCKSIINIKNIQAKYVRTHSDDHCFQLNSWRMTWLMNWHGLRYAALSLCLFSGDDHRHSDILCCQPWILYWSHTAYVTPILWTPSLWTERCVLRRMN
jgi:hypothetical protein